MCQRNDSVMGLAEKIEIEKEQVQKFKEAIMAKLNEGWVRKWPDMLSILSSLLDEALLHIKQSPSFQGWTDNEFLEHIHKKFFACPPHSPERLIAAVKFKPTQPLFVKDGRGVNPEDL